MALEGPGEPDGHRARRGQPGRTGVPIAALAPPRDGRGREPLAASASTGTAEALRVLRSRGYLLGVVTNRDRAEADAILQTRT